MKYKNQHNGNSFPFPEKELLTTLFLLVLGMAAGTLLVILLR
jgi:hypothetical protein